MRRTAAGTPASPSPPAETQQRLADRNAGVAADRRVHIRIGIHAGDVVFTTDSAGADDALGDGVNVASRVEAQAGAGEVFVSHDVFSITYDRVPFGYKDIGVRDLKNISRPIHLYELLWDPARAGEADAEPPRGDGAPSRGGRVGWVVGAIAVAAAVAVVVFHSSSRGPVDLRGNRPSLAVLGIADDTGDLELGRMQIGRILTDAVEQKFYEYRPVHLVSPLRVARVRKEMDIDPDELARDDGLVAGIAEALDHPLVISGRLQRVGGTFILAAQLSDLSGDGEILSRRRVEGRSAEGLLGMVDTVCVHFQQRLVDVLGLASADDVVFAAVGDLTTHDLEAYDRFRRGYELFRGGRLVEGARELVQATEIDSTFALAASEAACAFSFAKDEEKEKRYFALAQRHAGPSLLEGRSKAALIFQGNHGWLTGRPDVARERYRLVTELYPDDPDGYYYAGLARHYLEATAAGADRAAELEAAIELYRQAAQLKPGYFPIYYDWAQAVRSVEGTDAAVQLVRSYLQQYGEGPGAESARQTIVELRGA